MLNVDECCWLQQWRRRLIGQLQMSALAGGNLCGNTMHVNAGNAAIAVGNIDLVGCNAAVAQCAYGAMRGMRANDRANVGRRRCRRVGDVCGVE